MGEGWVRADLMRGDRGLFCYTAYRGREVRKGSVGVGVQREMGGHV